MPPFCMRLVSNLHHLSVWSCSFSWSPADVSIWNPAAREKCKDKSCKCMMWHIRRSCEINTCQSVSLLLNFMARPLSSTAQPLKVPAVHMRKNVEMSCQQGQERCCLTFLRIGKKQQKKPQTNKLYYQMGIVSVLVVVFLAFHLVSELDNKQCSDCCEKWMLFLLQGCATEMCCHFHYTQMLARKDSLTLVWDESCLPLTLWNPPSVLLFSPYRWKMTFIMFYILIEK